MFDPGERYGVTPVYMRLRIAERFGLPPSWALFELEPPLLQLLIGFETIRAREESETTAAIVRAFAAAFGAGVR